VFPEARSVRSEDRLGTVRGELSGGAEVYGRPVLRPRVCACRSDGFPLLYSPAVACVGSDGRLGGGDVGACVVAPASVPGVARCRHDGIRPDMPPNSGPVAVLGGDTGGGLRPMCRDIRGSGCGRCGGKVGTAGVDDAATPCSICNPGKPRSTGTRLDRPCARVMDEYPGKSSPDGGCVRRGRCQLCGGSGAAGGGPMGAAGGRTGRMRIRYAGPADDAVPFGFRRRSLRFRTLPGDGAHSLGGSARDLLPTHVTK